MRRRDFLRLATTSAAGLLVPSLLPSSVFGADGQVAPSNRLTMALIGCGGQGNGDLGQFLQDPRVRVVAVCDPDRERMAATKQRVDARYKNTDCRMHGDFRAIMARADIDCVGIATPDHWHAIPAIMAARAGKHIYLQKPIALTIPEGRAIANAVAASGVVCLIGAQQRSGGNFMRAFELVRNGFLGDIKEVQVGQGAGAGGGSFKTVEPVPDGFDYEMWLGPAPFAPYCAKRCHYQFRWIFDYSGGNLTDWISHYYDCAAWAVGVNHTGPVAIHDAKATLNNHPIYNTAIDYAFTAAYANGMRIQLGTKLRNGITFVGSEGTLWTDRGNLVVSNPRLYRAAVPANGVVVPYKSDHYAHFIDCIINRIPPRCPAEELHYTASVAHLANIAFRTGRTDLRWDPVKERIIDAPDAERLLHRAYRGPWQLPV